MKEPKIYTQKDVDSNINILSNQLDDLKLKRTELSKQITHTQKQILMWEGLDKRQNKMF